MTTGMPRSRRGRGPSFHAVLTGAVLAAMTALVAGGCGADGDSTSTAAAPAAGATTSVAATRPAAVDEAVSLVAEARKGMVYADVDTGNDLAAIAPQTAWAGPNSGPAPKPGATVEFVICAAASACKTVSDAAESVGPRLGWKVETVAADGTAPGFNAAMDTALGRSPAAIVTVGIPGSLITDKLAKARERGIVTVSAPDVPTPDLTEQPFDGYVSYRQPLQQQLMAAEVIADSGGTGKAIIVRSADSPDNIAAAGEAERVLGTCEGCTSWVTDWTIPQALDATKAQAKIGAALRAHPDAGYLILPYDLGLPAVLSSVRQAGREGKIKVLVKDGSKVELDALARGEVYAVTGVSLEWLGWAALNQVVLGLAGSSYLEATDQGLGMHLWTKDDVPADGQANYTQWVDWQAEYARLWSLPPA